MYSSLPAPADEEQGNSYHYENSSRHQKPVRVIYEERNGCQQSATTCHAYPHATESTCTHTNYLLYL